MKQTENHRGNISLRSTIWLYFAIFISSILILLWFSFVVSLESNYKNMKTSNILELANYIVKCLNNESITGEDIEELDNIAYANDMCVYIENSYGFPIYSYDMMAGNCLIHGVQSLNLYKYREKVQQSSNGIYYVETSNPRFNNNMLLFVMQVKTESGQVLYVYLNTSLEPLDSTTDIIKTQIQFISILLLVLGLGISFFLSKLLATPIARITRSAKKLAQMDYSAKFDGRGYSETETLAEALNYASSEMSKVDTLRKDLIANISHDLRTPLTMVKAYAEMVRDLSGDNPQKRNEHVGIIIEESDRLAALVSDILDLSKLESDSMDIEKRDFCISDTLSSILDRYKLISEQKGYKFILNIDKRTDVTADQIKIEQVIYNLINNAINYSGYDKTIYINQINQKNVVKIEITDTGKGIEPELLPLIFDRYYRAEKSMREVVGTGLGLSIVKQILEKHNYQFGVKSELGKGSTFWFDIKK